VMETIASNHREIEIAQKVRDVYGEHRWKEKDFGLYYTEGQDDSEIRYFLMLGDDDYIIIGPSPWEGTEDTITRLISFKHNPLYLPSDNNYMEMLWEINGNYRLMDYGVEGPCDCKCGDAIGIWFIADTPDEAWMKVVNNV